MRMMNNLSSRKATGSDGISVKILKLAAPVLCQPLTRSIDMFADDTTISACTHYLDISSLNDGLNSDLDALDE